MVKVVLSSSQERGHTRVQWLVAITANMTLLTYGMQAGWISPMTRLLQSDHSPAGPLTDNDLSWVASSLCLSAVFGVSVFTYAADAYGRKVGVVIITLLQTASWITKLSATSMTALIVGRILGGIAAGGCFNIVPMYVNEISQEDMRGRLGSLLILFQNLGVFIMYGIGSFLPYHTVLWTALGITVLNVVMAVRALESPAFLVKMGKIHEATTTVARFRGLRASDKEVQTEVSTLKNNQLYYYQSLPDISLKNIWSNRGWRRGSLLLLVTLLLAACNGSFTITTYAATIMASSGVAARPELQALAIPLVTIFGSFLAMTCIEKFGRKIILASSFLISSFALAGLASAVLVQHQGGSVLWWLPVAAVVLCVWANAAGVAPVPYIIMSEMFSFQIRAKVLGCLVTYSWFISFVQLAAFGPVFTAIGPYLTFYGFAAINLVGVFVTLVLLPETKAKSAEEIELELSK